LLPAFKPSKAKIIMTQDIRWKQRLQNYLKALQTLAEAAALASTRPLSKLEQQGLIQGFEFTHELAWNVLKDYLEEQGFVGIIGSKNASREAFKNGLIDDGQVWMDMIKARNLTSHTYNIDVAERIVQDILTRFYPAFSSMASHFKALATPSPDAAS
jgi:nucleotidyltransferase substrate binding protein (TIGR01987 family)